MVPLVPSGHRFAVPAVYHQEYKGRVIFAGDTCPQVKMGRRSVFVARVWWKEPCKAGPARALKALLLIPSSASMAFRDWRKHCMEMESCNIWPAVSGFFLVLTSYFHSLSICSMGQHSIAFCGRVMFHGTGSATFCLWVAAAVSSASGQWCHGSLLPVCFL